MNQYQFGRYRLRADVVLPLAVCTWAEGECSLQRVAELQSSGDSIRTYRGRTAGDNGILRRQRDTYVIDFLDARFRLSTSDRTIQYAATAEPADLLLDVVLPEFLAGMGELVLHGSAVAIEDKAVLLIGRSGSGKSTLAAALARRGHTILSDDFIAVCGDTVAPGSHAVKLWKDSAATLNVVPNRTTAAGKSMQSIGAPAAGRLPIGAIYFLERDDNQVATREISRDAMLASLMESRYLLDPFADPEVSAHLDRATRLAERFSAHSLLVPHQYATLPRVADAIEHAVMEYA